jgi:hypothetical protein
VGASPTRQPLQPEATGGAVEVNEGLKPQGKWQIEPENYEPDHQQPQHPCEFLAKQLVKINRERFRHNRETRS